MSEPEDDFQRLAERVLRRRSDLAMTQEDIRAAGGPATATLRQIESGRPQAYRNAIKRKLEKALRWRTGYVDDILAGRGKSTPEQWSPSEPGNAHDSIDAILDGRKPTLATPGRPDASLRAIVGDADPTFSEALEVYRQALQRLKRVATVDPEVPSEVVDIVEDWDMMLTALQYGGVDAVRRALADSYRRGHPCAGSSHQVG